MTRRRHSIERRVTAALACILAGAAQPAPPPVPPRGTDSVAVEQRRAAFDGVRLLALADGALLLWNVQGRAQLRGPDGAWTDALDLPLGTVRQVDRDDRGFVAVGSQRGGAEQVIVQFDDKAHEMRRWSFGQERVFGVVNHHGGRRAALRAGFVPLQDDGALGTLQPYPPRMPAGTSGAPTVVEHDGSTVLCWAADRSLLAHAPAECRRVDDGGWQIRGDFVEPPLACGEWLVVRTGPAQTALAVYALSTGTLRARMGFRSIAALACAGGDGLVVGQQRLSLVRLPTLKPAWSPPVDVGGTIRSLAVLPDLYAVAANASVWLVKRAQ